MVHCNFEKTCVEDISFTGVDFGHFQQKNVQTYLISAVFFPAK